MNSPIDMEQRSNEMLSPVVVLSQLVLPFVRAESENATISQRIYQNQPASQERWFIFDSFIAQIYMKVNLF